MKIYTRTGDAGETGLLGGDRVAKDHPRVAAFGAVDELNAAVGWAAANVANAEIRGWLGLIQHDLFAIGAVLATPPPRQGGRVPATLPALPVRRIAEMESWMDGADRELPPLRHFVLPGGARGGAALHMARTVCRRAERAVVQLSSAEAVEGSVIAYLNRLSDLLFTLARLENHRAGIIDVEWLQDR
jgi:cob(I)alamin adenosyltransferase